VGVQTRSIKLRSMTEVKNDRVRDSLTFSPSCHVKKISRTAAMPLICFNNPRPFARAGNGSHVKNADKPMNRGQMHAKHRWKWGGEDLRCCLERHVAPMQPIGWQVCRPRLFVAV